MIPGLGRSPEEGKGYTRQYSGLENSMDCIVHGVTKSRTRLSNFHLIVDLASQVVLVVKNLPASSGHAGDSGSISGWGRSLGEGMATCSNIFAWKIPWTEEPGWVTIHGVTKSWTQLSY